MKAVEFVLGYVVSNKNVGDSDSEQDFSDSDFSDTKGSGLKILTQNKMLIRLPISLAQLNAGNNSEKFKKEMMQLWYSLYRLKKLTKQLHKSLIDTI